MVPQNRQFWHQSTRIPIYHKTTLPVLARDRKAPQCGSLRFNMFLFPFNWDSFVFFPSLSFLFLSFPFLCVSCLRFSSLFCSFYLSYPLFVSHFTSQNRPQNLLKSSPNLLKWAPGERPRPFLEFMVHGIPLFLQFYRFWEAFGSPLGSNLAPFRSLFKPYFPTYF